MAKTRNAQKTAPEIDASHARIMHPAATSNSKSSAKSEAQSHTNTSAKTKKRSNARSSAKQNQREQIITVANRLFREKGYHKTSVSEIAHEVRMDQSSIYYWFPSKEAILEQVCDPNRSLSALDHIMNDIDDRVVQLYMLISYDVVRKCNLPFDFIEFEGLVYDHRDRFEGFLTRYREFYQAFERTISRGIEEGVFNDCLVDEQVVTILSITEGIQHHYHAKLRGNLILVSCDYEVKDHDPEAIGHMAARTIIPSMLATPQSLDEIRSKATTILEKLGLPRA